MRSYIAIDLKSFYASVECVERGLDPMNTNLVVADISRTEKTICLAVTPPLKKYGVSGRSRFFELLQQVSKANQTRKHFAKNCQLTGSSVFEDELLANPELSIDYIVAPPRMAHYLRFSAKIYAIYLKYIAPEDIHVYSVDEVFIDATNYLATYRLTAKELASKILSDIFHSTGITATAGIGPNLYLCKVAMDIMAKKTPMDESGVIIAELDEIEYRKTLWNHQPITDFWRIGRGYAKKLAQHGMYTMGDVAKCSVGAANCYHNEDLLYKLFGVNAELLIDHAWGYEPCTIEAIKSYRPKNNSLCSGQVLSEPYRFDHARIVIREMADAMSLDLVKKNLLTNQLILDVGYDVESLKNPVDGKIYQGEIHVDSYGRSVPKAAHGTLNLTHHTASSKYLMQAISELFDQIVNPYLLIRRMTITLNHIQSAEELQTKSMQLDIFSLLQEPTIEQKEKNEQRERMLQQAILNIKQKYGKNAVLRGTNFEEGATAKMRNQQIGGHRA